MKRVIFLMLLTSSLQTFLGQELIGFVDINILIEEHPQKPYYDSIYDAYNKDLIDSLEILEVEYNYAVNDGYPSFSIYRIMDKKDSLVYDSVLNQKEQKFDILREQIQNFPENSNNKLKQLNEVHINLLQKDILKTIQKYAKENNYKYIIKKSSFAYFLDKKDLTDVILRLMLTR